MSPDPFFRPKLVCQPVPECQGACPRAERGGFCGARIYPDCLQIMNNGLVRVGLSTPPQTWFALLTQLGDVLQITRNSMATLVQLGPLPELADWRNPVLPRDRCGSFTPNLAEYAGLRAVRESSPDGSTYGLEACDASGHIFHRIFLTTPAQCDLFEQFVTNYQSPSSEADQWFSPNHGSSIQRCRAITNRMAFLRSRLAEGSRDACVLPIEAISRLLTTTALARLPIRTTHYNRALIRAVTWVPEVLESGSGEQSGVESLRGDGVGLHVNLGAVARVWLWRGRCACCDQQHWTVEVADPADSVGLAFTAGDEQLESNWRDLLGNCLP